MIFLMVLTNFVKAIFLGKVLCIKVHLSDEHSLAYLSLTIPKPYLMTDAYKLMIN